MKDDTCWLFITESGEIAGQFETADDAHRHLATMEAGTVARHHKTMPIQSQAFQRNIIARAQFEALTV